MNDTLIVLIAALTIINSVFLVALLVRGSSKQKSSLPSDSIGFNGIAEIMRQGSMQQRERLERLEQQTVNAAKMTEYRLGEMRRSLEESLTRFRTENTRHLETVRQTVDEKLSETLGKRLNESFSLVSQQLEEVYKGIGEMNKIAENVSDIKRVFSNVKLRGTWGELQLDSLLSQMLAPNQYIKSCKLSKKDSDDMVDFAIILPTKTSEILLPVDSKFPVEEYSRFVAASENGDKTETDKALKSLEACMRKEADRISKKYIIPPITTEYAVMYFPLESLYAEAIKMTGLAEYSQQKRIIMCGPSNLAALLTALQTGFKTVAIERRSGELWRLLSTFRHEFSRFAVMLLKTQKKLQEAQDSIDDAARKTIKIERQLKNVSEISGGEKTDIEAEVLQNEEDGFISSEINDGGAA